MSACPNRSSANFLTPRGKSLLFNPWVREGVARRRLLRGAYLFRPGDPAEALFIVEEGLVKLSLSSAAGRDLTLGLYGRGDTFGEEVLLDGAERFAFAVGLEPSRILAVPRARVREAIARDPDLAHTLSALVTERLKDSARQIEDLAWSPVPSRLADALIRLARRNGVDGPSGIRIDLRITHQEIANLIGSTRETTTATLNAFRRRGWVVFVRRQIVLVRPDLLANAAANRA